MFFLKIKKANNEQTAASKRSLSVSNIDTANNDPNKKKPERGIYQPPSGKYSTNTQTSSNKRRIFGANRRSAGGRF